MDEWQEVWDAIDDGRGCPPSAAKKLLERLRDQAAEIERLQRDKADLYARIGEVLDAVTMRTK